MEKIPPASASRQKGSGSITGLGRFPGGGHGKPLQLSCLENSMDRGAWAVTVHRVTQSQTQLKLLSMQAHNEQLPELQYRATISRIWVLCD